MAAMHDALALTNLLYALPSNTSADIEQILLEYQRERRPRALATFKSSRMLSQVLRKDFIGMIARFISVNMPAWLWRIFLAKAFANRPQAGFLEKVEAKGSSPANPSPSMDKARAVFEERKQTAAASV